jgi:hypothetical protein
MHYLMIKTHNITGLKYLCYSKKKLEHLHSYTGSGKFWLKHIKEHGLDFSTEIIFQTEDYQEFKKFATSLSIELNVVESAAWANLKLEEGDGGDTVSNKMWITNETNDKYILKTEDVPEGWRKGRSKCVFNDSEKQKQFSSKSDRVKAGESIKRAWDEGRFNRDHSKIGRFGDLNVAKRPEVRLKISEFAKNRSPELNKIIGLKGGLTRKGKKRGPYKRKDKNG